MDVQIEKAQSSDWPGVLALQKRTYILEAERNQTWDIPPLTQTLVELQAENQNQTVLKATLHGALVGSVRGELRDGIGHIGRLMVEPTLQGRGIGKALMHRIENELGCETFEVFTGAKSLSNITLYQQLGYAINRYLDMKQYRLVYLRKEKP